VRIRGEDLIRIETIVGAKIADIKNVDCFVDVGFDGFMFVQIDWEDMHYRESITPHMCKNESKQSKEFFIERFAHYAARYFRG